MNVVMKVGTAVAALALVGWWGVSSSGAVASTHPAPTVAPSSVAPGGSFSVSGEYCDGVVTVSIAGLGLSGEVEGGNPPWSVPFTVPAGAKPGQYAVTSACTYFDFPDTTVTVTGATTTTEASTTTEVGTSVPTTTEATSTSAPTSTTAPGASTTTTAPPAVEAEAVASAPTYTG